MIVLIILIAIGHLTAEESPIVYEVEPDTPIHQSPVVIRTAHHTARVLPVTSLAATPAAAIKQVQLASQLRPD